jgi:glucan phosphoethanolaminetransferase (alkaline phosphatase superfamily)
VLCVVPLFYYLWNLRHSILHARKMMCTNEKDSDYSDRAKNLFQTQEKSSVFFARHLLLLVAAALLLVASSTLILLILLLLLLLALVVVCHSYTSSRYCLFRFMRETSSVATNTNEKKNDSC